MQNKRHTIPCSSLPDNQLHSLSLSSNSGTRGFHRAHQTHRTAKLTEKFKLLETGVPALRPAPIYILSMMPMVWIISIGQLGLAAWLRSLPAPAHLPISQTLETGEKSLISQQQLNTAVYYQYSAHTKSKTQQLLRR